MATDGEFGLTKRREKQRTMMEVLGQVKSYGQNAREALNSGRPKFTGGELAWWLSLSFWP